MSRLSELMRNQNKAGTTAGSSESAGSGSRSLSQLMGVRNTAAQAEGIRQLNVHRNSLRQKQIDDARTAAWLEQKRVEEARKKMPDDNSLAYQMQRDRTASYLANQPIAPKLDDNSLAFGMLKDRAAAEEKRQSLPLSQQMGILMRNPDTKTNPSAAAKAIAGTPAQDSYNDYLKQLTDYTAYTKAADFEKYSKQGAAIKNPTFEEAQGAANLFGWRPGAEKVGNIVTFSRENIGKIRDRAEADDKSAVVGDPIYSFMRDEEVGIYNYLLAKEGEESAQRYLDSIEEDLNRRYGTQVATDVEKTKGTVLNPLMVGGMATSAGLDQWGSGVKQAFDEYAQPTSAIQYAGAQVREQQNAAGKFAYDAVSTLSNMAPSILASYVAMGLGAPATVAEWIAAGSLGLGSGGNAYKQALAEGRTKDEAKAVASLTGASEAVLSKLLSGIGAYGGFTAETLLPKVAAIENAIWRVAAAAGVKIGGEVAEEWAQLYLEPLFKTLVYGDKYDAPEVEEVVYTALLTAVTTGLLEGKSIASYRTQQGAYADAGIEPTAGAADKGNIQTPPTTEKANTGAGMRENGANESAAAEKTAQQQAIDSIVREAQSKTSKKSEGKTATEKKQNAVLNALFGRNKKSASETDTAEKIDNSAVMQMQQNLEDAYAAGELTEEEFESGLEALMEEESLAGISALDKYNPVMMKKAEEEENAGSGISDGGGQRFAGASAGEQTGELAESAGRDQSRTIQSVRARDRADAVARIYEEEQRQPVSGRAYLQSSYVEDAGQIYDIPQSVIDGDEELRKIADEAQGMGMTVHFFTGEAKLTNGRNADAMIRGNDVYIRADGSKWTATQNWEHEKFHRVVSAASGVVQDLFKQFAEKTDKAKLRRTMEVYREAYHGICDVDENGNYVWDENAMYRVVEEILADAYAGKDTYAQGVEQYTDTTRDAASQIEERGVESRGPPENFAVVQRRYEEAAINQDVVSFVEKVRTGNAKANEKLYLGTVSDSVAERIQELTGTDVKGFRVAIEARQMEHILKDHGEDGAADRTMKDPADIGKIEYTLQNPDDVTEGGRTNAYTHMVNGRNRTAPTVLYEKRIGAESYYVVEAVPNTKAKTLYIVTAFKGKPGYQGTKKEAAQLINAQGPDATPESGSVVASNEKLSQSDTSVKSGEVFSAGDDVQQDPVEAMPAKAQRAIESKEFGVTSALGTALRVPFNSRNEQLRGLVRGITDEFIRTGDVSEKTLEDVFERAYRPNEQKLAEEFGVDVEEYRDNAERDFRAQVENLVAEIRLANRYAADREGGGTVAEKPIPTLEQLPQLYDDMKAARRVADKAVARNLLTESDNAKVNRLLRGDIDESMLNPLTDNVTGILEVYRAKAEYEKYAREIRRWNKQRKAKLIELSDKLLETAGEWKDKNAGWKYSRETMERNVRDIVKDKALADEINDTLFKPVHDATAKATRMKNEYRERVRALGLSRKVAKGNEISEAAAVQLLGEAEDNIRYLQKNKFIKMRDGKTLADWQGIVRDLWESNPNLDAAKIRKSVDEFRAIYDELFEKMNESRMRNGYEPVNYRKGYFPHFQSDSGDGILKQFGRSLGINTAATQLPTTINGITHTFKPGIQWFGSAQQRMGVNTSFDAVEGFDSYIEGVADVIHQTDNIQRLRAFATQVRYRTSDDGLRKQIDKIRNDPRLTDLEKQNEIEKKWEEGKFELANFAVELDEYTNLLANKKSRLDRTAEQLMGRRVYSIMKAVEKQVAANMVAVNPGSWITNLIPITQGAATLDNASLLAGMWDTLRAIKQDDGMVAASSFLTNRRGSDPLVRTWAQETSAVLSKPMELIDSFTADTLVRARYNQNIKRGMSEEAAISEADEWAAGVMADRSKGAMPTWFSQTNPFTKLLTQFQLEVNNQLSYVFKDIPQEMQERGKKALALAMLKFMIGAYLYDEVYEYLIGRRPALDPLGIINDTVGDLTGYELGNLLDDGFKIVEVEKKGLYEAGTSMATSILEELPFVGSLLGGGRLPISSAFPDKKVWQALFDSDWAPEKRIATAAKELAKPAAYIAAPFGGGQVKKIVEGLGAVARGGSYSVNSAGEDILQYPVANDTFGQAGLNAMAAMLFGKSSLPAAREWVESGFDSLNANQTELFESLRNNGAGTQEAFDLIVEIEALDTKIDKMVQIGETQFDESLKELAMSNQMSFSQYEKYMAARAAGVSTEQYTKLLKALSEEAKAQKIENQDGKPSTSQIETEMWAADLTPDERRALWDSKGNLTEGYEELLKRYEGETDIGAGSVNQKVLKAVLSKSKLSNLQKRAIWNSYGWSTKSPW